MVPARSPSAMRRRSAADVRLVSNADRDRSLAEQRSLFHDRQLTEQPAHRELVLLGQHLGRRHERALVPALHRHEQRAERDDGLARTHLALQQPVHRRRLRHVVGDLRDGRGLVVGERERERGVERGHQLAVDRVHDAGLLRRQRALARDQRQLHAQELVELQTLRGRDLVASSSPDGGCRCTRVRGRRGRGRRAAWRRADRRSRALRCAAGTTPPRAGAATCAPRTSPTAGTPGRSRR